MADPLAEVVTLLQPGAPFCRLATGGHEAILLQEGDFALVPAAYDFTMSSRDPAPTQQMAASRSGHIALAEGSEQDRER